MEGNGLILPEESQPLMMTIMIMMLMEGNGGGRAAVTF